MKMKEWIGVDLDGTLAKYDKFRGIHHIGEPIPEMKDRVMRWIEQGHLVKIFTARVSDPEAINPIIDWLIKHEIGYTDKGYLQPLEITNVKDFGMSELWDDRAVGVEPNTGRPLSASRRGLK